MTSDILYVPAYLLGSGLCFYLWKRSKDKDYFWLSVIALIIFFQKSINYVLEAYFKLPLEGNILRIGISILISATELIFFVLILLLGVRKFWISKENKKNATEREPITKFPPFWIAVAFGLFYIVITLICQFIPLEFKSELHHSEKIENVA